MISTRDLSELPDVDTLRRLMQSLAMLDAILSPEWEYRYFSFNSRWSPTEQMGSMRNGQGDHYFALFNAAGCWLKGFAHEAPMSPFVTNRPAITADVLKDVPAEFASCLAESAFVVDETTFCIWRLYQGEWQHSAIRLAEADPDPDGSARLLRFLDGRPGTYRAFAAEYYEREIPLTAVQSIYSQKPLAQELVSTLNNAVMVSDLTADADEIGYPVFRQTSG